MSNREDAREKATVLGTGTGKAAPSESRMVVHTPPEGHALGDTAMAAPAVAVVSAERPIYGTAPTELSGPEGAGETEIRDGAEDSASDGKVAQETGELKSRDPLVGSMLLDRYQITTKIGQGGMGAVYEARHTLINKRVAVKVLLDKYAQKDQVVARLKQEAQLASTIGHENIIDITDFGQTPDGRTFVVMEYLDGESLADLLAREGPLPEQRAIRIGHQIASALFAAHEKGIVHRDVKPENIFLLQRKGADYVKVVDFGISKSMRPDEDGESQRLTKTGMVIGTPLYMSPEQARGDDALDHRIDVYAVGVILYELVTGRVPFQGSNYLSIISQVLNDEPPMPRDLRSDLSAELEAVILRALEKDPVDRYQTSSELANDLHALIEEPGHTTANKRITAPLRRRKRKGGRSGLQTLAWMAGIAVIASAVVVTVAVILPDGKPAAEVPLVIAPPPVDAGTQPAVVDATPAPAKARVQIITFPRADLFLDNRLLGRTPYTWETEPADASIELIAREKGFKDTPFLVNPAKDDGKSVAVDLRPLTADPRKPQRSGRRPSGTTPPPDQKTGPGTKPGNPQDHDLPNNPYGKKPAQ